MSVTVEGEIKYYDISEKTFGKYNNRIHSVTVNGQKYGMFLKQDVPVQKSKPGDTVSFDAEQNDKGYWNADPKSFKVLKRASGSQQASNSMPPAREDDRQLSICRQSSMNYAAQVVGAMTTGGRMNDLNVDEVAAEVIRLADEYFLPYAMRGEKNYGVKDPVSDYRTEDQEQDDGEDIPF